MKNALRHVLGLTACFLTLSAHAGVTEQLLQDDPLTFTWKLTWDGSGAFAKGPKLTYWTPVFSIANLDAGQFANDLDVLLTHLDIGPEKVEKIDHDTGTTYHYIVKNIDTLPENKEFKNIVPSEQSLEHLGKGIRHRDDFKLEYKHTGKEVAFQLSGVHVDSPVPEPSAVAMLAGGLLIVGGAARRRKWA